MSVCWSPGGLVMVMVPGFATSAQLECAQRSSARWRARPSRLSTPHLAVASAAAGSKGKVHSVGLACACAVSITRFESTSPPAMTTA